MIKVGISGAQTADSGELIRILAAHPDVEIVRAVAPGYEGMPLTSVHHGLIGETSLCFTDTADFSKCDVLFLFSPIDCAELNCIRTQSPELKVILLEAPDGMDPDSDEIVYGLPEMNRKPLVRGATAAYVPKPFESMALVALFPFASHLLLNGVLNINVSAPKSIIDSSDLAKMTCQIEKQLRSVQKSFTSHVELHTIPSESRRSALMYINFSCGLSLPQLLDLYNIYDDHRFSFVTTSPVGVSEVAGTNKCVVTVAKSDMATTSLCVAADCRLRGGAGEAVHIMNLMCGLYEKTGLNLKAADFEKF